MSQITIGGITALAAGTLAAITLAGCGGGSPSAASGSGSASTVPLQGVRGGDRGPAASGTIAAIDGNTLQVQNQSVGQVAVVLTAKTTYTQTNAATRAAVTVGSCIVAISPTSTSGSTPPTAVTATAITVNTPSGSSCTPQRDARVRPGDAPSGFPSGFPGGQRPTGAPDRFREAVAGRVTAVSGSAFTVSATMPGTAGTRTVTVATTAKTTYLTTVAAARSDVHVGLCASAVGSTDSTGTVAATRLSLSRPGANGCETRVFGTGRNG